MFVKFLYKSITVAFFTILFISVSAGFVYAEDSKTATVAATVLNLRESPSTAARILDQLTNGIKLKVIGSSNGWYKVSENGITGWVSGKFLSFKNSQSSSNQTGIITGNTVNLRKGPGLTYDVITQLDRGEKATILSASGSWYKISTSDGSIGWVSGKYISGNGLNPSADSVRNSSSETSRGGSSLAMDIIDYAKRFLGVKYTYGGTTPGTGFDCSGFTRYVFARFGIKLERVAADQATQGIKISKSELKPGDLIFSDTDGGNDDINHVGIYIGGGKFISAASGPSSGKVVIDDVNSSYWKKAYMTARRVL